MAPAMAPRARVCCALCFAVVWTWCPVAQADDVYLKNGRVIRNVKTREHDGRLWVTQGDTELAFPLGLVERVETKDVVATSPPLVSPRPDPSTSAPTAAPKAADSGVRTSFEDGEVLPKNMRYDNGIDIVTFTFPPGVWTYSGRPSRQRATGQDDDPYGHMNPSNIMMGIEDGVAYKLSVWPFVFHPDLDMDKEEMATIWLSLARTELREGPMQTRSAAREANIRVGAARYLTTTYHHFWRDSGYRQDGIFLLYFPRDYKQKDRFYVLQWFVTYKPELDGVDLWLPGFETIVRTFNTRPSR